MPSPVSCRLGTAALEFALVAPIMVLLVVGLGNGVRRTLARIDLEAASHAGALAALAGKPVAPAVTALDPDLEAAVTAIDCTARLGLAGGCTGLPPGHYVAVTLSRHAPSLFGTSIDSQLRSTTLVRLP